MFGPRNRTWVAKTVYAQEKKREAKEGARPMTFDWSFVQRYAPFFVNGTLMTLFISVFGILLAIAVGLVCAGVEIARIPVDPANRENLHRTQPQYAIAGTAVLYCTSACPNSA